MPTLHVIDSIPTSESAVAYLAHTLERAKAGELSAVAIAWVNPDGSTGSGWSDQPNLGTMVGSVEALKAKLVREMIDEV